MKPITMAKLCLLVFCALAVYGVVTDDNATPAYALVIIFGLLCFLAGFMSSRYMEGLARDKRKRSWVDAAVKPKQQLAPRDRIDQM